MDSARQIVPSGEARRVDTEKWIVRVRSSLPEEEKAARSILPELSEQRSNRSRLYNQTHKDPHPA